MSDPVDTDALRETGLDLEPVRTDERLSNTQWARVHIAKRALFTAADEVDRLRLAGSEWQAEFHRAAQEAIRLRAVIENAPHGWDCAQETYDGHDDSIACSCWKADAL